jgi:hypothetical protein
MALERARACRLRPSRLQRHAELCGVRPAIPAAAARAHVSAAFRAHVVRKPRRRRRAPLELHARWLRALLEAWQRRRLCHERLRLRASGERRRRRRLRASRERRRRRRRLMDARPCARGLSRHSARARRCAEGRLQR